MAENKETELREWKKADGWEKGTCLHSDPAHTFCTRCVSNAILEAHAQGEKKGRREILESEGIKNICAYAGHSEFCAKHEESDFEGECECGYQMATEAFTKLKKETGL